MNDLQRRIAALPPAKRALLEARLTDLAPERDAGARRRVVPRDRGEPTPLALTQQREWAVGRFRSANNITGALRLEGNIDLPLLGWVLTEIISRHEVLRTTVRTDDRGLPVQEVQPVAAVPTPIVDLSHLPADEQQRDVERRAHADAARPFAPDDPCRLRVSLLRLRDDIHVALFAADHAASDAWSLAIIVDELTALYRAGPDGRRPEPLAVQFGDFAVWQRSRFDEAKGAAEVEHWRAVLSGMPTSVQLPADRPYPAQPTYAAEAHVVHMAPELTARVRAYGEQESASLFTILLAAAAVLLNRHLASDDVVIGSLVSGRTVVETERLIGSFANPVPLRMRPSDDRTLRDIVLQARRTMADALEHQDVPFDRLVDGLGLGREAVRTSFSPLWINVLTVGDTTLELPGLRITPEPLVPATASVDLTLNVMPSGDRLLMQWQYMTELFDAPTVALLAMQFEQVLEQVVTAPDIRVRDVVIGEAASTTADATPERTDGGPGFVELFRRRVAHSPHAPAVVFDGAATSYAELDAMARRIARRLRALGVVRDARVGILVDRSPRMPAAILGVLGSGAAYVPLDPTHPPARLRSTLADAGAAVLVTERHLAPVAQNAGAAVVLLDEPGLLDGPGARDDGAASALASPPADALAYVVYTSGSTGRPKGVMIEHGGLAAFAGDVRDRLGLGATDRFLQFASPGFDVLAEELFPVWLAGGAVVVPAAHLISGEDDLLSLIERERVTVIELPTAYWHEWIRELDRLDQTLPSCLRLVIIGGERVLPERIAAWRRRTDVPLQHVYGLTETTVSSTFFRLDPADPETEWPNLPIGTALPSVRLRVLDRWLRPVPGGGTGELYIGGVTVGRGYVGRPELTAERFVADPDPAQPGERLYRTGDLVRQRPDGMLEFVSRVDAQVKIRGFRVEPAEIEAALVTHPEVADAVVTAPEFAPGDRRLVAYVVGNGAAAPMAAAVRSHLAERLPPHMVPSAVVELDAVPLTANGKVDRDRLPTPDDRRTSSDDGGEPPASPAERRLAEIIAGVVGVAEIGRHDNFFEVGGDSILAIQVVARAQEAGMELTPYDLFAHPTAAALVEVVDTGRTVDAEQGEVTGPVPLTPAQRHFCARLDGDPDHWNSSVLLDLAPGVDPALLRDAVGHVLGHHDALRLRFELDGTDTRARIAPHGDGAPVVVHDFSDTSPSAHDRRLATECADLQRSLDLHDGPMVRVALFQMGGARPDRLAVVAHRLAADVASLRIVLEDLETAVVQLSAGEPLRFLPKTTSWRSWAERLHGYAESAEVQAQRGHWSRLSARSTSRLPGAAIGDETEADARTVVDGLDTVDTTRLLAAAEHHGCSLEALLLAALARALRRWTGQTRHVVDLERHDRPELFDDVDLSRTVGWFSRVHPLLLSAEDDAPEDTLRAVVASLDGVPADGIGWSLLHTASEAAEVRFTYTGAPVDPVSGAFVVVAESVGDDRSPRLPRGPAIEVDAGCMRGALSVRWRFGGRRYAPDVIRDVAAAHLDEVRALSGAAADSATAAFPLARVDRAELEGLIGRLADGGQTHVR